MKKIQKITIIIALSLSIIVSFIGVLWYSANIIQPQAEIDADKWFHFDVSVFEDYGIEILPLKKKWSHVPLVLSYDNILFFGQIAHESNVITVYYRFEGTAYYFWFVHAGIGYEYSQKFGMGT